MKTLTLPCPAKLNLFLHVTGQRSDGYHNLQTLFQLLDCGDELTLVETDDERLVLQQDGIDMPAEHNLVYRAAALLRVSGKSTVAHKGAHITLRKHLPSGGGLGGGSSDAASTLLGLNQLWGLGHNIDRLAEMGLELGADVPLFVRGFSAWAEGVGEQLTPVDIPPAWYLIARPDCAISTAQIFSNRQLTRNTPPITIAAFFAGGTRNDCQAVARSLHPEVDKLLNWLENFGHARMTGSGACCFLSFQDRAAAEAVLAQLPDEWRGWIARGVNHSPVHQLLH